MKRWLGMWVLALVAGLCRAEDGAVHQLISGPMVAPSPVIQNSFADFWAVSNGQAPVTWIWDFGDGTTSTDGPRVNHAYSASGTYLVTVTAKDARGLVATGALSIVATPDVDCGCGGPGLTAQPMQIKRFSGKAFFAEGSKDKATLSGILPDLPPGFIAEGKTLLAEFGGAQIVFVLDAKGKSKSDRGSAVLSLKPSKKNAVGRLEFGGGPVKYTITFSGGTWSDDWLDEGVSPATDAANVLLTFKVSLTVNLTLFSEDVPVVYSAKSGKSGMFKTK